MLTWLLPPLQRLQRLQLLRRRRRVAAAERGNRPRGQGAPVRLYIIWGRRQGAGQGLDAFPAQDEGMSEGIGSLRAPFAPNAERVLAIGDRQREWERTTIPMRACMDMHGPERHFMNDEVYI